MFDVSMQNFNNEISKKVTYMNANSSTTVHLENYILTIFQCLT